MKRKPKLILAWGLLIGSVIGWPITALTVAKQEPQVVLALSWIAIIITALDALLIVDDK